MGSGLSRPFRQPGAGWLKLNEFSGHILIIPGAVFTHIPN